MSDQDACEPPSSIEADEAPESESAPRDVSGLVLVSTPIGNLGDVTMRGLAALRDADLVLCEDTRTTAKLLSAYSIGVRCEALHDHNEEQRIPGLIARLRNGAKIALVSDAGTPLVSDPGFRLVRAAIAEGIRVTAAPGANAALLALTLSGLPPHPFLFLGFPPARDGARRSHFAGLRAAEQAGLAATMIWYEAPHRLPEMLADLATVFGAREAVVARELTKRFEEVRRGDLPTLAAHYAHNRARGEIVVLIGPGAAEVSSEADIDGLLVAALATMSVKDAAAMVAAATGSPKKAIYARALELKD
jgi:16S rRNA (cytidine1402-2'-O)-methyltransferase